MTTYDYTTKKRPVRVTVDATAIRPPGRGRGWTIEAGDWRAEGSTEKAAADALAEGLHAFLGAYRRPLVLAFRGHTVVTSVEPSNDRVTWWQEIITPSGRRHMMSNAASDWTGAEASARHGVAQVSTDWHDDASVCEAAAFLVGFDDVDHGQYGPKEFYRYAAWQRAAKAAMDAGRDDLHEWATRNRDRYAIAFRFNQHTRPDGTPCRWSHCSVSAPELREKPGNRICPARCPASDIEVEPRAVEDVEDDSHTCERCEAENVPDGNFDPASGLCDDCSDYNASRVVL